MDGDSDSSFILSNSQVYPAQTFEYYHPDAASNEGHFYSECSNGGLCDREVGECVCFESYTGHACQRTVCPNDCNGRGTCESISELATTAAGTLFHKGLDTGDTTYNLWDKKASYGCKCDPGFYGPDCSLRHCKVGVDPLYEAVGSEILETISIFAGISDGSTAKTLGGTSYYRIRLFDYWGESYITDRIIQVASTSATTTATNVATALKALPNNVIDDVTCTNVAVTVPEGILAFRDANYENDDYTLISCRLDTNPGKLRLAEISDSFIVDGAATAHSGTAFITGTMQRGEDFDITGTVASTTLSDLANGANAVTLTGSSFADFSLDANKGQVIKLKGHYMIATAVTTSSLTLGYNSHLTTISSGTETFHYCSTPMSKVTETVAAFAIGSTEITMSADPSGTLSAGKIVFFENQFFTVVSVDAANSKVYVDRPFYGQTDNSGPVAGATADIYYWNSWPTANTYSYVSECSGRGLCDTESGVCTCFKGYSNDNCDTQNIMSF